MGYKNGSAYALTELGLTQKTAASVLRRLFRVVEEAPGRFQAYLGARPLNAMHVDPVSQSVSTLTALPKDLVGVGLAKKFYGDVMRRMPNQTLRSDTRGVTLRAREVWRGMEKRPGYTLNETPNWTPYGQTPLFSASLPEKAALGPASAGSVARTVPNAAQDAAVLAGTRSADRALLDTYQDAEKVLRQIPQRAAMQVWDAFPGEFNRMHRAVRGNGPPAPLRWADAYANAGAAVRQHMDQALASNPKLPKVWDAWQVMDNRIGGL